MTEKHKINFTQKHCRCSLKHNIERKKNHSVHTSSCEFLISTVLFLVHHLSYGRLRTISKKVLYNKLCFIIILIL